MPRVRPRPEASPWDVWRAAAGQDGAGRRSAGRWTWTTMLTQHAPAAACASAGLSLAPAERAAAGRWNDPGVDDDRPAEHVLRDAEPRDPRQDPNVSQQSQPCRPHTDQPDLCFATDLQLTVKAAPNGGSRSSPAVAVCD